MSSTKVKIAPRILKWARVSLHLTEDDVVNHFSQKSKKKFGVDLSFLRDIEDNEREIKFTLLQELAALYKRPLAVFFLTQPPTELPIPKDRRTIASGVHKVLSPEAVLVLRRARYVQEVFAELAKELNWDLSVPLKKVSLGDDPKKLAAYLRDILDFSFEFQAEKIKNSRQLFSAIRERLEGINIFTLKATFPLEDARALSLVDKTPFLIVINNRDGGYFGYAPKSFSLLHELAHILLREGALCNDFSRPYQQIEKFCNEFSASFLVPDQKFLEVSPASKNNFDEDKVEEYLDTLRTIFKVSREVLLRKYLSFGFIDKSFYEKKVGEWKEEYENREQGDKGKFVPAITPARRAVNNNSRKFVELVLYAKGLGKITFDKAADYLGVSIKSLPEVESFSLK
ncbi:MAG TPA: ImmA/IrrE family metallo-endopeptidase [Candidatus Paceibacterota bacterium]|nr:ImmA/IrrE family metallo-endopeptidase [Candidatus Paceibacterota bacterium]